MIRLLKVSIRPADVGDSSAGYFTEREPRARSRTSAEASSNATDAASSP